MNRENLLHNDILEGREKRAERQQELVSQFCKPLVSFSLNIPGANKSTSRLEKVHRAGLALLTKKLRENYNEILLQEVSVSAAGHQAFLVVEADSEELKRLTVSIEEQHPLGRIFDYDVFNANCKQINRASLGLGERTCLLCGGNVTICRRSGKHSLEDILQRIDILIAEYFSSQV